MEAMILAAGRGERLRPITDSIPKPLITVGGLTLIEHHLYRLSSFGFKHVVINVSYLGEKIMSFLGDGSRFDLKISYSIEADGALGTAGGILNALEIFQQDQFLVVNGDVFTDFNFSQIHPLDTSNAHLVLVPNPPHHPEGDFCLRDGVVQLSDSESQNTYTFAGIGLYRKSFFDSLVQKKCELGEYFRQLVQKGEISGTVHRSLWIDVGSAERLQQARLKVGKKSGIR